MIFALLAALCFCGSALVGRQAAHRLGGIPAFYGRTVCAVAFLTLWAFVWGSGWSGAGAGWLFISGLVGFGLGDLGLFLALPRLGSRLTLLIIHCLAAPIAGVMEWLWLGTVLGPMEIGFGLMVLAGVGLALAPQRPDEVRDFRHGVWWGLLASLGQAGGAVLSRQAYAVNLAAGFQPDGLTVTFQRVLGGLAVVSVLGLVHWSLQPTWLVSQSQPRAPKGPRPWWCVAANALIGPTLGVACFQYALQIAPSAVVLPIAATSPLLIIPFAYWWEGDKPGRRAIWGGSLAVIGVMALLRCRG